jgi:tricorn protease
METPMHPFLARLLFVTALILVLGSGAASAETKLLRFPDIHGDKVVFCHAGDLWTVASSGGVATRLTAHPGQELFPKFSPDGRWIAFTGQYDGDEQVYVIPAAGGVPAQLTYYPARGPLPPRWGYDNQVYGWTPDSKSVLFRSMREGWSLTDTRLYTVPVDGGLPEPLPMTLSGGGDLSPDGKKVVYSPLIRDFRTWKRYQGGWAQDLYVLDLESHEFRQITDHPRSDRDPMWIGEKVYFSSDRTGTLNLYSLDLDSKETKLLTNSRKWDVRWPSKDDSGQIVYELNGGLHVLNTSTGDSSRLSISVPDDGLARRPSRVATGDLIEDVELSPKGERALIVARGDIFTAPIEKGPSRNLTNSSGAHDKWARWSPDGKRIAFISDMDGEEEIYIIAQDGSGKPEQLTDGGNAMRYAPEWAPDGKRLAFSDKDGRLYVLTLDGKKPKQIADEARGQLRDYAWSPNGGHIAFSMSDVNDNNSLYVWSVETGKLRRITGETFNEFGPAWDPEGSYLFYLSDREYAPQIGAWEWNYVGDRETAIFALALREDVEHPFAPESDEVSVDEEEDEKAEEEKEEDGDKKKEKEYIKIDFDGLASRVARVPVPADNYGGLSATKGHLLYVRGAPFYYGRESDPAPALMIFSMEDREASALAEDVGGYALSADGEKVLVQQSGAFHLYDAKPEAKDKKTVSTANLYVDRIPAEEWEQIFDEVWRRFRDFFYVENMHGYDWEALRDQYRPLLKHVSHRSDLNYLIGEMIAELNVSHAYMQGGDYDIPARPRVGLPGALFELDRKAGRYRIAKILEGHNEETIYRSPLTEIGVEVAEGDYVLAIDGEDLAGGENPYRLLVHKADRPVTLTVNDKPSTEGAREVTYHPISSERNLNYLEMVNANRRKVSEMTGGRAGYLHVPNMGAEGIREFIKWFYPQIRKEGLVIDVRHNGGGNVSQMLIERLGRDLLAIGFPRTNDTARTYPHRAYQGHLVCMLNEDSASDGDIFPAMFRQAGLGPLIGKRSWGGVTGITNRGTLIDGGSVFVPEFGFASAEGKWVIEGYGVDPDIEVDNDPKSLIEGRDPQLERAVQELMTMIEQDPRRLPTRPAPPVKTE